MLTPFTVENGGTLVVPGSHRSSNNPADGGISEVDPDRPYPTEAQVTGAAGSVLVLDSRLWHAINSNRSDLPRVALVIRYAPWWLNLDILMPGSQERGCMVDETGGKENEVEPITRDVYSSLVEDVKPLFRHWVR